MSALLRMAAWPLLTAGLIFSQVSLATGADAPPQFGWPVACTPGQSCWIVNYADDDPSTASAKDFTCGDMTYEGHDGTDIAIRDHRTIADNIAVLAAADGVVQRTRDSVEDGDGTAQALEASRAAKNGCGNAVMLDHGNGWQTLYCHMKRGSIDVSTGQRVQAGDRLGAVGQSGLAGFAHVHFGVMHNGQIFDPFTGQPSAAGCGKSGTASLWRTPIPYETLIPYAAGFSSQLPETDKLVNDTSSPGRMAVNSPVMAFWILLYGAQPGDHIGLQILDPENKVYVEKETIQEQKKIRLLKYIGLRTANHPLRPGIYTGKAILTRTQPDGQVLRRTIESKIEVRGNGG